MSRRLLAARGLALVVLGQSFVGLAETLPDGDVEDLVAGDTCTDTAAVRIWADDRWGAYGPTVSPTASDRELTGLEFSGPIGARAIASFRVTNTTDGNALYSLKASSADDPGFASALRFREVGFLQLNDGTMRADPIFDLPLGEVLRIAPRQTAVVWVDVQTALLAPGRHEAKVSLVPGYSALPAKILNVALTVSQTDVRLADVPVWTYPLRTAGDIRLLADYGFNTSCLLPTWFAPIPQQDGSFSFSAVDKIVAAFVANGIPKSEVRLMLYAMLPSWAGLRMRDDTVLEYRTPEWREEYVRRVRAFIRHVSAVHGIGLDRIYFAVNDEPSGDPDDPDSPAGHAFYGADLAKEIDPGLKSFANPWKPNDPYLDRYLEKFDVLEPFLRPIFDGADRDVHLRYRASGRELWSYTIYIKENSPHQYRQIWWAHLDYGFDGPATFYDLFDHSGDSFNSHDGSTRSVADYNAVYANESGTALVPSRRLEEWYLGMIDFKAAKVCRDCIAAAGANGIDTSGYERAYASIARDGNGGAASFDDRSVQIQALAQRARAARPTDEWYQPLAPHTIWERDAFWDTTGYRLQPPQSAAGACQMVFDSVVRTSAESEPTEVRRDPPEGLMILIGQNL